MTTKTETWRSERWSYAGTVCPNSPWKDRGCPYGTKAFDLVPTDDRGAYRGRVAALLVDPMGEMRWMRAPGTGKTLWEDCLPIPSEASLEDAKAHILAVVRMTYQGDGK